ncbi:hypothetical protein ACIGFL_07225 [Pseudomonas sp. NPDC077649]|uniref:hypothetical protein n=1 Tax=Pseudomonas sp. NPDC077649 TaxID=3364423 RepID=UPI0037C5F7F3
MAYVLGLVFIIGETSRRGFAYFSVNITTMVEDYSAGIFLLTAALWWSKKYAKAPALMAAAWGYSAGGMLVPFFAHLEAYVRGATFRPDHLHEDLNAVIAKGIIWGICLACLVITLRNGDVGRQRADMAT